MWGCLCEERGMEEDLSCGEVGCWLVNCICGLVVVDFEIVGLLTHVEINQGRLLLAFEAGMRTNLDV